MKLDEKVQAEYNRLRELFAAADENKLALLDGQIWENARLRVQLDQLAEQATGGLLRYHPTNPSLCKPSPVAKLLVQYRASYVNSSKLLCRELGVERLDDEDDLEDFA